MTFEEWFKEAEKKLDDVSSIGINRPLTFAMMSKTKIIAYEAWRAATKDLAEMIPSIPRQPNLGLATTGQLLDELRARCEVNGTLNYRTAGPKEPQKQSLNPVSSEVIVEKWICSEAVYALLSYLTNTFGVVHIQGTDFDDIAKRFIQKHNLTPPREGWKKF